MPSLWHVYLFCCCDIHLPILEPISLDFQCGLKTTLEVPWPQAKECKRPQGWKTQARLFLPSLRRKTFLLTLWLQTFVLTLTCFLFEQLKSADLRSYLWASMGSSCWLLFLPILGHTLLFLCILHNILWLKINRDYPFWKVHSSYSSGFVVFGLISDFSELIINICVPFHVWPLNLKLGEVSGNLIIRQRFPVMPRSIMIPSLGLER